MTTLQMQNTSHFETPALEDPMELTSDMDRRFTADDDIDIDLDLTTDNHQDEEDAHMGEDINVFAEVPHSNEQEMRTGNDDEMADDVYAEGSIADRSSVHDEDLEDAESSAPDIDEETIIEAPVEPISDVPQILPDHHQEELNASHDHDLNYLEQLSASGADPNPTSTSLPDGQNHLMAPPNDTPGLATQAVRPYPSQEQENQVSRQKDSVSQESSREPLGEALQQAEEESDRLEPFSHDYRADGFGGESELTTEQPPQEEEVHAPSEADVATSQNTEEYMTVPGETTTKDVAVIHPVIVIYQDTEISLFPLVGQDEECSSTYFLQDEHLAGDSLKNLLWACRTTLGESISDQDELVISIKDLGLYISESTIESSTVTLLQLIEIYVHLQHCDGLEDPPPLYMNLTTKTSFLHRFEFLQNAVLEGRGLSQLRSFEVDDEAQNLEADRLQGHGFEEEAQHVRNTKATDIEAPAPKEGAEIEVPHDRTDSQSEKLPLLEPLQNSDVALPALEPKGSNDVENKTNDGVEAQIGTSVPDSQGPVLDVNVKDGLQTQGASAASLPPFAGQIPPGRPDEGTIDSEDSIEYEDEEELGHGTSSGSSTLQGDALEPVVDQDQSEADNQSGLTNIQEIRNPKENLGGAPLGGAPPAGHVVNEETAIGVEKIRRGHYSKEEGALKYPNYPHGEQAMPADEPDKDEDGVEDVGEEEGEYEKREEQEATEELQDDADFQHNFTEDTNYEQEDNPDQQGIEQAFDEFEELQDDTARKITKHDMAAEGDDAEFQLRSQSAHGGDNFLDDSREEEQTNLDGIAESGGLAQGNFTSFEWSDDHGALLSTKTKGTSTTQENEVERPELNDDEISYESEEDDENSQEPLNAEHNAASSPGSLKRARSPREEGAEDDLQGGHSTFDNQVEQDRELTALEIDAKRVRSG